MKENGIGSYRLGRRQFLAASALASAGLLLGGCRREAAQQASQGGGSGGSGGNFPDTPEYNFVFVNHVTTNPFFVPTQYGAEDASALLNTKFQWTGSETANVGEMVNAFNTAIAGNADGIAIAITDQKAFNGPTDKALEAGIPVVSY